MKIDIKEIMIGTGIIMFALCCISIYCAVNSDNRQEPQKSQDGYYYRITVIDGCEYVYFANLSTPTLTHKGNCTNHVMKVVPK